MRYYRIELSDQDGAPVILSSFGNQASPLPLSPGAVLESGVITSLLPDGTTNPAALNVEVDIEQIALHQGNQKSYVRIFGLALADVYRKDLNPSLDNTKFTNISVKVGMAKGLPLANPAQQGVVIKGSVWQAFGNWLGTDMTLDLVVGPGGMTGGGEETSIQPQPYVFQWAKGQTLADALSQTLKNNPALAAVQQDFTSIASDRTSNADKHGVYSTVNEFAQLVQRMTVGQRGSKDQGVLLHLDGSKIKGTDTSQLGGDPSKDTEINFQDLIGQVTWYEPFKLTCKLVMRGDLELGGYVKFTSGANLVTNAAAMPSLTPSRDRDTPGIAQGARFYVERIHHWGNFRQADAMSWNTTLGLVNTEF